MANVDTFFLQPFKTHRKRLVPGQRVPAKTKHHALNEGERLGRIAEGVAVIYVSADNETGEVSALEVRTAWRDPGGIRGADPRPMKPALSLRHTSPQLIPEWERNRFWTVVCDGWPVGTIVEHPTAAGVLPAWQWTIHVQAGRFANGVRLVTALEGDALTRDACLAPFKEAFERCLEHIGADGWAHHVEHMGWLSIRRSTWVPDEPGQDRQHDDPSSR